MDVVLSITDGKNSVVAQRADSCQPQPSMTLKEIQGFCEAQRFDVTALVLAISEKRDVNPTREVVQVHLIDAQSPWQNGPTERAGGASKELLDEDHGRGCSNTRRIHGSSSGVYKLMARPTACKLNTEA